MSKSSPETGTLLPCPFCGSSRVGMGSSIDATDWGVICSDCGASCSTSCETHDDAVASWNTRKPSLAPTPADEATEDDIAAVIVAAQTSNSSICAAALLQKFKITSRSLVESPHSSTDRTLPSAESTFMDKLDQLARTIAPYGYVGGNAAIAQFLVKAREHLAESPVSSPDRTADTHPPKHMMMQTDPAVSPPDRDGGST